MKNRIISTVIVALIVTVVVLLGYHYLTHDNPERIQIEHVDGTPAKGVALALDEKGDLVPLDFSAVAEKVTQAVVHIKSTQDWDNNQPQERDLRDQLPDPFRDFFGDEFPFFRFEDPRDDPGPQQRIGTGSGVIISEKGFVVTNNHVINNADDIEVTLADNRTFEATVVGTDPSTDLALLQIDAEKLSSLPFVNSDDIKVGEWVLAVGNPMGLNSTVTAGIVSAKGRNINILRERFAIESFIQTDAAINPGNSGGALVDLQGAIVGINTAIASPTGVYAGYGFAVPSNIVNKVIEDLMTYGRVQRGVLGVIIRSVDGNLSKEKDLAITQGAYVDSLMENSAAAAAGIAVGDVIIAVEGKEVNTSPQLQERIAAYRPGDKVRIQVNRQGDEKEFLVELKNYQGEVKAEVEKPPLTLRNLGAKFEVISHDAAKELKIEGGVKVIDLYPGVLRQQTNMREGFIITKVAGREVQSLEDLATAIEGASGGIMLEGIYEDQPGIHYYAFGLSK